MIPIKIQCDCGQKYAFDIEPVNGQMPQAIACPSCGIDGTPAANAFITQSIATQPIASGPRLRTALATAPAQAATPAPKPTVVLPPNREQVKHEARAKILWGDSATDVTKFLMMQGFSAAEATEIVAELSKERARTTRVNGIRNVVIGVPLIFVPFVAWGIFSRMGYIPLKIFAFAIMAGVYGAWLALKGTMMLIAPKIEAGDVADQ